MEYRPNKYFLLYDTETSSLCYIGQILTAYFRLCDDQCRSIIGFDLRINIKVSPLELPHPDAILTNRVYLSDLQSVGQTELVACRQIVDFFERCLSYCGPGNIKLIGFNSSRFDLPFLRTLLIRNGCNPYFRDGLLYADALHWTRKLAANQENFPAETKRDNDKKYYTYSLESIGRRFRLMNQQRHEAESDVALLQSIMRFYTETFVENLWQEPVFEINEPVFYALEPALPEEFPKKFRLKPFVVLDRKKNDCLLIDLLAFEQNPDRQVILYRNAATGYLYPAVFEVSQHVRELANDALITFSHINCANYFAPSDCDIEQDIYRLKFTEIGLLNKKIQNPDLPTRNASQDFMHLWRRHRLKHLSVDQSPELRQHYRVALKEYTDYRYVKKRCKLNKFGETAVFAESYSELRAILEQRLDQAFGAEREILEELRSLYDISPVAIMAREILERQSLTEENANR